MQLLRQRSRAAANTGAWTAGLPGPTPGSRRSGLDPCGGRRAPAAWFPGPSGSSYAPGHRRATRSACRRLGHPGSGKTRNRT